MDSGEAVQRKKSPFQELQYSILADVQDMQHQHNRYIRELRCAYEFVCICYGSYVIVIPENARPSGEHERRYNAPTSNDIADVMPNDPVRQRDIFCTKECISELHKAYDPLQHPILSLFGSDGWSPKLKLSRRHTIASISQLSLKNYILLTRKLFHQLIVDAYAKTECCRLHCLRHHQGKLREDSYGELRDVISHQDNADPRNLGQRIFSPSSYNGGPGNNNV
ncbi:DNA helicase [Elysia marginata]|uniref:DNA helicase n=1 Tax=Elysia marginata TaxID=1093978 RepID=A0AAV4HI01_9GAST|nr:DNA helicase [Elysia marginata]